MSKLSDMIQNQAKLTGFFWQEPIWDMFEKLNSLRGGSIGNFQYMPVDDHKLSAIDEKPCVLFNELPENSSSATAFNNIQFNNMQEKLASNGVTINQSVVVLCNGSSMKNIDFKVLSVLPCIGMNAAYRYWQRIDIYPDYYLCLDTVVTESIKNEIYQLIQNRAHNCIKLFFLRKIILTSYPDLAQVPEIQFFEDYIKSPYFEGITHMLTTGSFAALLGAMLGYKRIYLLGIDLNYVQQIPEAKNVQGYVLEMAETPQTNPNYFFNDYQRKGDRFNIPDSTPDLHYQSWLMVKERLDQFGTDVVNCNSGSKLNIFDKTKPFKFNNHQGQFQIGLVDTALAK